MTHKYCHVLKVSNLFGPWYFGGLPAGPSGTSEPLVSQKPLASWVHSHPRRQNHGSAHFGLSPERVLTCTVKRPRASSENPVCRVPGAHQVLSGAFLVPLGPEGVFTCIGRRFRPLNDPHRTLPRTPPSPRNAQDPPRTHPGPPRAPQDPPRAPLGPPTTPPGHPRSPRSPRPKTTTKAKTESKT